jgi:hypothetical protein
MSAPCDKRVLDVVAECGFLAVWRSIAFPRSPAFRVLTTSAHLVLVRIEIERANGRHHITHAKFEASRRSSLVRRLGYPRKGRINRFSQVARAFWGALACGGY